MNLSLLKHSSGLICFLLLGTSVCSEQLPPTPSHATGRLIQPELNIAPDHPDWTYSMGENVVFHVSITCDDVPVEKGVVNYMLGPEQMPGEIQEIEFRNGEVNIDAGTLSNPGFLRCEVRFELDGMTATDLATAGFEPETIKPTVSEPDDFDEFWQDARLKNDEIELSLRRVKLQDACTDLVNVYQVSFQTWPKDWRGNPSRMYGILCEPVKPGKYPAVLQVPGAGVRAYHGDIEMASKGVIVLQIGIHGIPVTLDDTVYVSLGTGALNGYQFYGIDHRETHYYHRVYLGCVRANDVLTQHPMWDGEHLVTYGGSQGGQLSIVTAGLDKRVTGNVSGYPAYCDLTGYLCGRAGGWPHTFKKPIYNNPGTIETNGYFDTVNFARRIHHPSVYGWGYNDQVCPPTSMYAAYNSVPGSKKLFLNLQMGHSGDVDFWNHLRAQLYEMIGLGE